MASWFKGASIALTVWVLILLAMPFVGPPGRRVAIVGEEGRAVRAILAAGGRVVDVRSNAVIGISEQSGFPLALYRNGARLVLEGRVAAGCFGPKSSR